MSFLEKENDPRVLTQPERHVSLECAAKGQDVSESRPPLLFLENINGDIQHSLRHTASHGSQMEIKCKKKQIKCVQRTLKLQHMILCKVKDNIIDLRLPANKIE